uniref:Uncharacterized protein n=1 Tax=Ciona savignyi TaxID=51511 RepID=H2Z2U1_CIOSA
MRPYCERMFEGADTFADVDIVESNLSLYRYTMRKMIKIAFNCDMATFSREFTKHLQLMGSIFFRLNESLLRGRRQAVADCLMRGLGDGYSMIDKAFSMCAVNVKQEQIDQFVMNSKPHPSTEAIVVEPVSQTPLVVDGPKIEIDDTGSEDLNKTDEASGSSDDWKLHVPEAWVDTISNDIEKQKSLKPQPPFSEAYIAGMPASKRRKVGKTD